MEFSRMSNQKLLKELADFFNMSQKKRIKNEKELKALLKVLRQKEKKLIKRYNTQPGGDKRKLMKREIAILHTKRKKGLKALKNLTQTK